MSYELRHNTVGTALSRDEWEHINTHKLDGQVRGDLIYAADTTYLKRLAVGSNTYVLTSNGTDPVWAASVGTATVATTVTVTDNESTAENNLITFVAGAATTTGAHGLEMDGNIHYNPSTGLLTSPGFAGALTGNATGLSATLAVGSGGTGATSLTDGGILLGNGSGAIVAMSVLSDGNIVVGDGTTDPVALAAFTASDGTLKHESGGIEADISAIAKGGLIAGSGTGSMAIRTTGTDDYVLTADDSEATGMKWAAVAAGVTLSGSTDNTVVTVTGSNAMAGEANLTYSSDILELTSSSASLPRIDITNTHADATAGEIRFNKNTVSGDDNDIMGKISWYGTDAGEATHEELAYIDAIITDSAAGSEAASLRFYVAENDATRTLGLQLAGQADDNGEIDVTIGAGAASTATIAGTLTMGSTATLTNAGLVVVANQSNITGVSTITSGTWEGDTVAVDQGGTGATSLTSNAILTGNATSAIQAETTLLFSSNKLIPTATAHGAVGTVLTMSAGATTAGTTDNIAGGALTLQGGQGKGSGAGGSIIFQTANAAGSGSSLNALATALTIEDDLNLTLTKSITYDSTPANPSYSGVTATFTAGETLEAGEVVYLKAADTKMWKAVSVVSGTGLITPEIMCVAMAAEDISADAAGLFLLQGFLRDDTNFPTYAIGETLYVPEAEQSSLNVPHGTIPTTDGDFVQVIGWAADGNTVYFNPDFTIIEHA